MPDRNQTDIARRDTTATERRESIPDLTRLTDAERVLILTMHDAGKTQTEIAQVIGCSQPTVSRWLSMLEPTDQLARKRAYNISLKAINKLEDAMGPAAEQGKSGPMEAILKITGLLGHDMSGGTTIILGGDVRDLALTVVNVPASEYAVDGLLNGSPVGFCPAPTMGEGAGK